MAKKIYAIDNNATAQTVNDIYIIDSNNTAKLVKEAYGVDSSGTAHLCFSRTSFTTNQFPTSWTGTSTTANYEFTATNSLGNWIVKSDKKSSSSSYIPSKAVDGSTSSYHRLASTGQVMWWTISLPSGIFIRPTAGTVVGSYYGANSNTQGRNARTSTWETIYTISSGVANTTTTNNFTTSTKNYYDMFGVQLIQYSSSTAVRFYEFQITSGVIADEN